MGRGGTDLEEIHKSHQKNTHDSCITTSFTAVNKEIVQRSYNQIVQCVVSLGEDRPQTLFKVVTLIEVNV